MIETVAQPDLVEKLNRSGSKFGRNASRKKRDQHVIDGSEVAEQIEALKNEADLLSPKVVSLVRGHTTQSLSGKN